MPGNMVLSAEEALKIRELAHRTPIYLSPDGARIGYTVRVPEQAESVEGQAFTPAGVVQELVGSEVHVQELENETTRILTKQWGSSWGAGWSSNGNCFLFLSDKDGEVRAWIWDADQDQTRSLCDARISAFFGCDVPLWMPDGNTILIKKKIEAPEFPGAVEQSPDRGNISATVTVFSSDDMSGLMEEPLSPRPTPAGKQVPSITDCHLYDLGMVDLQTGAVEILAGGFRGGTIVPSYDGSTVAVLSIGAEDQLTRRRAHELYLVDVCAKSHQLVSPDIFPTESAQCLSWSPDSRQLALINGGDLFICERASCRLRPLTEDLQLDYKVCEPPLWNTDGTHIYYVSHGQVHRISVEDGKVKILAEEMGRIVVGVIYRNGIPLVDGNQGILLQTLDPRTGQEGIYRLDQDFSTTCLFEEDAHIGNLSIRDIQLAHYTDCTPDKGKLIYVQQRADRPPDIWLADATFENRKKATAINSHLGRTSFGSAEFIDYLLPDGEIRKGVVLLPSGETADPPYPLIVSVYPRWHHREKRNLFGAGFPAEGNAQLYATSGYAVLWPDMKTDCDYTIDYALGLVLPAVDKAIELGLADPSRVGLIGHSAGADAVNGLVTQTDRFAAAISMSGGADKISEYGYVRSDGSVYRQKEQERSYGGPPWEVPQVYLQNSPLMYVANVKTSLLFIHGDKDDTCGWQVAAEMFAALRRLSKRTEFALYRGEGHIPYDWSPGNRIDLWNRILNWFNLYLGR